MTIFSQTGQSDTITQVNRALALFTNRLRERRRFASYLNDDPPRATILFFHGDGGNGKSLLLRLLREKYCHRLSADAWAHLKALEDGHDLEGLSADSWRQRFAEDDED